MANRDERSEAIRTYLQNEFSGAELREEHTAASAVKYVLRQGGQEWPVSVMEEFLERHEAAEITRLLREWNVADELRRAEGLEFVLTSQGVRLESAN